MSDTLDNFLHADISGVREEVIKLGMKQGLASGSINHILERLGRIEKESTTKDAVGRIEVKLEELGISVNELKNELTKRHKTKRFYLGILATVVAVMGAFDGLGHVVSYLINYYK